MSELISVVIPAYNAGPYIGNCLDNVLRQTYEAIEILVVDDGSTDETGAIIDRYQKDYPGRVHAFHTENRGVTNARFEGIRHAKGDWIGFVDGDDEIEEDMYARLHANAVKYAADISHCGHQTIVNDGERVHLFYGTGDLRVQGREEGLRDLLDGKFEPSLWNKLFRKESVQKLVTAQIMDTSIKYNEDLLMNYYLFKEAGNSVFEDFCGYHYLARNNSASRKGFTLARVTDPVKVRKQILEDSGEAYKDIIKRKYIVACGEAYAVLSAKKEYKTESDRFRTILKSNKSDWKLLSKNERIKVELMFVSVKVYRAIHHLYEKYCQKRQYE